jgi:beta-glucosidase
MTQNQFKFPADFIWGTTTSAYQIEGAAGEDGKGESIWDRFAHTPRKIITGETGDVACNHYHHYAEDVTLMRDLGTNGYRFSIAWTRILPEGTGNISRAGLDFYDRLVDLLLENDIIPFATLYHWDLPQALQDKGGWANRDTVTAFIEYTSVVAEHLGDRVRHWITHNEPFGTAFNGHYYGRHAPGIRDFKTALQVAHHVLLSHGFVVPVIRQAVGVGAQVGIAPNYSLVHANSSSDSDQAAKRRYDGFANRWFLDALAGGGYPQDMWDYYGANVPTIEQGDMEIIGAPLDFLGINYYYRLVVTDDPGGQIPEAADNRTRALNGTAFGWEIYPAGLFETLSHIYAEYPFPAFYITENGAAFFDEAVGDGEIHDTRRIAYLEKHLAQAARAIEAGIPLKGYFIRSLLDNFEWIEGTRPRFGLVYTDFPTQQRIVKQSGYWYRDVIAEQRT